MEITSRIGVWDWMASHGRRGNTQSLQGVYEFLLHYDDLVITYEGGYEEIDDRSPEYVYLHNSAGVIVQSFVSYRSEKPRMWIQRSNH